MDNLIYGLEYNTRSLTTLSCTESVNFLVGTQKISGQNQIHYISLDEDNKLKAKIFPHEDEIWGMSCNPCENEIMSSISQSKSSNDIFTKKCSILKLPNDIFSEDNSEEMFEFESCEVLNTKDCGTDVIAADFHPLNADTIACVMDKSIAFFNINNKDEAKQEISVKNKISGGMWNGANQFVTIQERNIVAFDTRDPSSSTTSAWIIEEADSQIVRDIDVNPNKAFHIVCGGDDGVIKIFDSRKCREPVFSTGSIHQHWIFSVSFNKFHDQLLLSSSSDGKVALTRALSCSSEAEAATNVSEENAEKSIQNGVLQIFSSEHDDSVYCVEWSFFDPWTFASLSYDGRLIISRVPKEHKFQIIL